ncbi:MAG: phytoene/squalene synthase family protein [Pseudomonadota bacterium]
MTPNPGNTLAPDEVLITSQDMITAGSKSFAAAARLFAPQTRADAIMLYAWCRHADDLIDGQTLGHDTRHENSEGQKQRLSELREQTRAALNGVVSDDPVFEALRQVVHRNRIPGQHPMELIKGFEMDVSGRKYRSETDMLDYCYHVAGVVGVMMAIIMGVRDEDVLDRASDLGLGFQMTNIARDVIDDAKAGRVYLPSEWLEAAGIDEIDPSDPDQRKVLHSLALRLIDKAEPYYDSAYCGLADLPFRSAWAVAAAHRVYRDIGNRLRKDGVAAWDRRVATSPARKAVLLSLAIFDVIGSRLADRQTRPERRDLFQRPR